MSNEKNEQLKALKEAKQNIEGRLKPLLAKVGEAKEKVPSLLRIIKSKKDAMLEAVRREEEAKLAAQLEQAGKDASSATPVAQPEGSAVKEPVTTEQPVVKPEVKTAESDAVADDRLRTKTTYINPDLINMDKKKRDSFGRNSASVPTASGNKFPPRDNGANRGAGNSFAPRRPAMPSLGGRGAAPAVPPPSLAQNRNDKKKKTGFTTQKDSEKRTLNKRDLLKKGYVFEGTTDDDGDVRYKKQRRMQKEFNRNSIKIEKAEVNTEIIPIKVFSEKIGRSAAEIVKKLFDMGKMSTINDSIDFETAALIAMDYEISLEYIPDVTAEDKLEQLVTDSGNSNRVPRPPVVTIMGHVDHGKTSLLDYIRKTNVVKGEAGGITQHIGAYTISLDSKPITFLDTPGHEAFTSMRRRGAMVTDIAIIVVAADDGIMPQTIEAINHAKEANVQIVVAVNKIDKPGANIDRIKNQLPNYGLLPEEWGGDVYVCPVSAKSGEGVHELLESVLLVADVMELTANKDGMAQGSIIEARLDKGLGPVATVLVQSGTLKVGDFIVAGTSTGRIRAMTDYTGRRVKEAGPSFAVQAQGFTAVPNAGDNLVAVKDAALGKQVAEERAAKEKNEQANKVTGLRTLEEMFRKAGDGEVKKLSIIIKGDVQGSVEAVTQSMLKLSEEMSGQNVVIRIIHSAAGAISESDIMLADTAKALVIGFNVKAEPKAKALADRCGVEIRTYSIIYDAIDDVTNILNGMTEPIYEEDIIGHAEIREVFKITGVGNIAGCYVTDGKLSRGCKLRLIRDNIIIYNGVLNSLKREKDDAKDVAHGYECGVGLQKWGDIKKGDIIEAYLLVQVNNNGKN